MQSPSLTFCRKMVTKVFPPSPLPSPFSRYSFSFNSKVVPTLPVCASGLCHWLGHYTPTNLEQVRSYRRSQKLCATLQRIPGRAQATTQWQKKVMHLLDVENVETCDICAFKTKHSGENSSEHKRKLNSFSPTDFLTNRASQTDTLNQHVRASYWRKTSAALTALQGTTEVKHSSATGYTLVPPNNGIKNLKSRHLLLPIGHHWLSCLTALLRKLAPPTCRLSSCRCHPH